ncbi:hypothetical protein AMR72_10080 [Flavobacterium psychrophilum]|nr:hypothetical protein AMR72_10080 [Flavobacterium psychrophilum]AOE52826.1 hypothetical protein ALW18_10070 [Flavobacterium psychrophilum]
MNKAILLIPHYNNPEGLIASVGSIDRSEQIDVLVVDDGSVKNKLTEQDVISAFTGNGEVYFIYLEENSGIEHALNRGLQYVIEVKKYKYIARLDSGDYCLGKRFAIQQEFLEINPDIKMVGSNVIAADTNGNFLYNIIMPEKTREIRNKMFLNAMFIHPTVMFCTDILPQTGLYPVNRKSAEDYAFFFIISNKFKTANIQQFLVKIEINPSGISISRRKQQVGSRIKVIQDNFYFGFYPLYGLARNILLYIMPNSIIQFLKRKKG